MTDPQPAPAIRPWPVPRGDRTKRWYALWGGAVALVVAAVVYFLAFDTWGSRAYVFDRCAEGVWEAGPDEECVGVTDGSFSFDDSLDDISADIHRANRKVEKSGQRWVTVAYVHPLTVGGTDKDDNAALQELEGAYVAQDELNNGQGTVPRIKLVIANTGAGGRQWEPVTERLTELRDDREHPLVAVTGFGPSYDSTTRLVDALRRAELPMIGGTSTADELTSGTEPGFFRVNNPNGQQASAIVRHLKERQRKPGPYRVAMIKDRDSDEAYSRSLSRGFERQAKRQGLRLEPLGLSYEAGAPALANAFGSLANQVCQHRPDAVYFAGRGRELRQFINAMAVLGRRCEVTVFTGDDAVSIYADGRESKEKLKEFNAKWRLSNVTVRFTALAHPDMWSTGGGGTGDGGAGGGKGYPRGEDPFPDFAARYDKLTGRDPRGLVDGQVIAVYDAMLVAGRAIQEVWTKEPSDEGEQGAGKGGSAADLPWPPKEQPALAVRQMLLQIKKGNEVAGLSGLIYFGDDGNPVEKPLPIVELLPSEHFAYGKFRFMERETPLGPAR
ncbi:ABC transporter substrate-binding protein [Streptomyces boluensis]|uniref:ABC transporter substrate-binding protein n=1 Tax=Streptomyces boluensis TaxID=1775135 RepID=A0A964UZX4_9ACTN|nr:ABC transporter substrate-binding protein [Streptomyces boluensis]NBE55997.1 ABC transporter substrate-binding protein [Streptomyces boluensis]